MGFVYKHLKNSENDHDQKKHAGDRGTGSSSSKDDGITLADFGIARDGELTAQEVVAAAAGMALAGMVGRQARRMSPVMRQHRSDFFSRNWSAPWSSKVNPVWKDPMTTGVISDTSPVLDDIGRLFDGTHTTKGGDAYDSLVTGVTTVKTGRNKYDIVVTGDLNPSSGTFRRDGWFLDDSDGLMTSLDNAGRSESVGYFTATFSRNGEVHHDMIDLTPTLQGAGLSESFIATVLPKYPESGWQRASFMANLEVGGYAWARAGVFRFRDTVTTPYRYRARIARSMTEQAGGVRNVPRDVWRELFDAKTPAQLSQVGRGHFEVPMTLPGGHETGIWPAKQVFMKWSWDAVIDLT